MSLDDRSPDMNIPTAEDEVRIPETVQETPGQNLGGMRAGSRQLSYGKIKIAGVEERIYFGEATDVKKGVGIFMGKKTYDGDDNKYYDFRFGDPENNFVRWDHKAGDIIVRGQILAESGSSVDGSYIKDLSISNAKIKNATIDKAKISSLDASDIATGTVSASYVEIGTGTTYENGYDPSTKLDSSDVGDLADYDLVKSAMEDETIISGGYIDASYLTADNITTGTLHANYIEVGTINAKNTLNGPAEADADVTSSNETFSQNSDIDAKQTTNGPDEANADVTGNNTANDTNYLGGALIENLSAVAVGINGELSLQSHALLDVTNIGMTDELHISDDWYIYPSSRSVPDRAPLNITNLGTDYNEAVTNWDQHPYDDQEGKIGTYNYSYDKGYFWTLYTDDGNVTAWQTHDDIQMIKDIGTKEIEAKTVKAKGPECSKSKTWDLSDLPDEIQKGGKLSHGALNGLLIGTLKQLIEKVETLGEEVEALK